MRNAMGRGAAVLAAMATALMLCLAGTANAAPTWYNHGGCNYGEAVGKGALPTNTFDFNVCQRSADIHDVYGDFEAAATPPANALVAPKGPVTCADIEGNVAAFYYPFDKGSMPPPNPAVTGLLLVATDGGPTGDKIGFEPVLAGANADCSLTNPVVKNIVANLALPVTSGFVTVTDKHTKH